MDKHSKSFPPSFVMKNDQWSLNPTWVNEAFEMHAAYVLHVEKLLIESRGKHKLEFIPQGPAQRRVIYTLCEYYGLTFTKTKEGDRLVAFDVDKAYCSDPHCEDNYEFTRWAAVKKIVVPSFHFPENFKMPKSLKDLWLERQENKDLAIEKLARMMDDSNKPSYTTK